MKKYIFILFLPCFCLLSYGQITIEGQVVNKTGLPIAYASIGLENDSTGTISDLNGNFKYTFNSNSNKFIKVTHVSYMTKLLPYSTYSDRHKLTIELTDKNVALPELSISANALKPKGRVNKGLRLPSDVKFSGEANNMECGPFIKSRKKILINDIIIKVKECTYTECTLSVNIYKINSKSNMINILNKPLYYNAKRNTNKFDLDIRPNENIILEKGQKYYISLRLVDEKSDGHISFPLYMKHNLVRDYTNGNRHSIPVGLSFSVIGKEIQ